jgi:hypothetical protein
LVSKRRKLVGLAAGLGLLQGLTNVGFALFGGPPGYKPRDQIEAAVAVVLMILQGVAMIIFAVATYRGKLYGAYGLLLIALLFALLSLVQEGKPGWIIPPVIYFLAAWSLHSVREKPKAPPLICPECSAPYNTADYRTDTPAIYCAACKAPLPRSQTP